MKYAVLTLSGSYHEGPAQLTAFPRAGGSGRFRFDTFLVGVERILSQRAIRRVLVECRADFAPRLYGGAEAVREQLGRLSHAGKEVWFYAKEYDYLRLYLASACTHRAIHPLGTLTFLGTARPFIFYKNALDKNKIDSRVIRRGKYKSAGDSFTEEALNDANVEQHSAYLAEVDREIQEAVEAGFTKSGADLKDLSNGTMLTASAAKDEGWIDQVATIDTLRESWQREKWKKRSLKKLKRRFGKGRKRLAVLLFEGAIIDGESKRHPLLGESVGDASFLEEIEKVTKNRKVVGVVLRINSGGGSATASEEILAALSRLAEKKPLVVSMSEFAGSGGYWIALKGERIFAHRTTLTGSIGVLTLALNLEKFLKRHGVTSDTLRTAPYADLGSPLREMSKPERKMIEALVDELYHSFLRKVSEARDRPIEEIEKIAKGRIWAGSEAILKGLTDEVGDLTAALDYLRGRLGLKRARVHFYPEEKRSFLQRMLLKGSPILVGSPLVIGSLLTQGSPLNPGTPQLPYRATQPLLLMPESLDDLPGYPPKL